MKITQFERAVYEKYCVEGKEVSQIASELTCNESRILQAYRKLVRKGYCVSNTSRRS